MSDEQVAAGETVLTSGGDQIFPKGLPVGTVSKVGNGKDLFLNIKIKPAANLSKLEEVLVLVEKQERQAVAEEQSECAPPIFWRSDCPRCRTSRRGPQRSNSRGTSAAATPGVNRRSRHRRLQQRMSVPPRLRQRLQQPLQPAIARGTADGANELRREAVTAPKTEDLGNQYQRCPPPATRQPAIVEDKPLTPPVPTRSPALAERQRPTIACPSLTHLGNRLRFTGSAFR